MGYSYKKILTGKSSYKFTSEEIRQAIRETDTCAAAARFLGIDDVTYYNHTYKRIDEKTGLTFWELTQNKKNSAKKLPKRYNPRRIRQSISRILSGHETAFNFPQGRLKHLFFELGFFKPECSCCKYKTERKIDGKVPLILFFKDRDRRNYRKTNISFICYNCAFLKGVQILTSRELNIIQKPVRLTSRQPRIDAIFELDDTFSAHLDSLNLEHDE